MFSILRMIVLYFLCFHAYTFRLPIISDADGKVLHLGYHYVHELWTSFRGGFIMGHLISTFSCKDTLRGWWNG